MSLTPLPGLNQKAATATLRHTTFMVNVIMLPTASYDKRGIASQYGTKFHGRLTSSREPYDMLAMTAASPGSHPLLAPL